MGVNLPGIRNRECKMEPWPTPKVCQDLCYNIPDRDTSEKTRLISDTLRMFLSGLNYRAVVTGE